MDLGEYLASLNRTVDSPDDRKKGKCHIITISQMAHLNTFNIMRGNGLLRDAVYQAPTKEPKDLIANMTKDMESEVGPG